ncbi:hypothetical protein BCON_0144g00020 [Botryotinia convoluta]|uniref:Uncharacterized protein n=1 Tax=Botryotinia convoluta TaxID=54673 RepID=A0A4Z1HTQ5_9HELO|nr:hypothetical protein BCON_0144g00020 [Botryotinia convoluta]
MAWPRYWKEESSLHLVGAVGAASSITLHLVNAACRLRRITQRITIERGDTHPARLDMDQVLERKRKPPCSWCCSTDAHGSVSAIDTLHFSQGSLLVSLLGEEEGAAAMTCRRSGQGPKLTNPRFAS